MRRPAPITVRLPRDRTSTCEEARRRKRPRRSLCRAGRPAVLPFGLSAMNAWPGGTRRKPRTPPPRQLAANRVFRRTVPPRVQALDAGL